MISRQHAEELLADHDVESHGTGPVVALAHGAGGGVSVNFGPVIDTLGGRRRLVGPHYPGAGDTPAPEGPLPLEGLAGLVVAAGVAEGGTRFPVLGLSLGAAVAVTAAVRHPEHVSALVVTVGLAHPDAQSTAFARAWRAFAAHGDRHGLAHLLLLSTGTVEGLEAVGRAGLDPAVDEIVRTHQPGSVAHAELVERADVRPLLTSVRVPTLVVVAGADRIVLPSTARRFAEIPGSVVVDYPDAGHIFGPSHAARWAADVAGFLDAAPGR